MARIRDAAAIEASGFLADGRLISRDTNGVLREWALPAGRSRTIDTGEDPVPLPDKSPDGIWEVSLDRDEPTLLRAVRRRAEELRFQQWAEEQIRHSRRASL